MNAMRFGCWLFVAIALAGCAATRESTSSHQGARQETLSSGRGPSAPSTTLSLSEKPLLRSTRGEGRSEPPHAARHVTLTGRAFLQSSEREEEGYGLYSYLLLGCEPADDLCRNRCLAAFRAYLGQLPNVGELERHDVERACTNVTYCPVKGALPATVTAEWILENYDYARAQILLAKLQVLCMKGPYIISYADPLSSITSPLRGGYLYQDLSRVNPDFVPLWVTEFKIQAAQECYWNRRLLARFCMRFRDYLRAAAEAWPDISRILDDSVQYNET